LSTPYQPLIDLEGTEEGTAEKHDTRSQLSRSNLLEGLVPLEPFGGKLPTRPIRGGGTVPFVPGWWFIQEANALFGFRWSFEIEEQYVGEHQVWVRGKMTVPVPASSYTETYPDGRVVERKTEAYTVTKTQYGGADIKRTKDGNRKIIDIGDDLKSAATDAFKKCCTQFGIALSIYGKRETDEQGSANSEMLDAYYALFEKAGKSRDDALNFAKKEMETRPEDLTGVELIKLMNKARSFVK